MIPGPVEISPAVLHSFSTPPPGHLAPPVIEAFGASLEMMRQVWLAADSSLPFVVAGAGTLAMEMAAANLVEAGDTAVVVNTGYFSDRLTEMLRRYGAKVREVTTDVGDAPSPERVSEAFRPAAGGDRVKALFATHVDTSTGVRVDPEPLAALARENGALSVFDGVCATAAERFDMKGWGADVYLTASQKAIGLPPGLALLVVSARAFETRQKRTSAAPPMYLDWAEWRPIMEAYEQRRPAYFSTPATNLVLALATGLREILAEGMEERFALHRRAAQALRAAWLSLGLTPVPARPELVANTLSALRFPAGVDGSLIGRILEQGVVVAGGLHPAIRTEYFRVGHMGYAVTRPDMLESTIRAVARALDRDVPAIPAG
jgi:alanine-glyoxylate transaminase/serine-glyoxylate transaminase/serine-pyruvate transaminase